MRANSGNLLRVEQLRGHFMGIVRFVVPQASPTWDTTLLAMAVALLPLFYLTLKNWTEAWLVVLGVVSAYGILKSRLPLRAFFPDPATAWMFIALAFPVVAVFTSILIRGDFHLSLWKQNLDLLNGAGRLFLAGVALLWMNYRKVRFLDAVPVTLAAGIIVTFFFATVQQPGVPDRYTTSLLDLCTFGQQICLLGLLQFYLLVFHPPRSRIVWALSIVAILLAAKMGIAAGGRGGWIAVPPLLVIAALLFKGKKSKILVLLLVAAVAVGGVLAFNQKFRDRLTSIYSETSAWFAGDATAGGSGRLTLMAISWELIKDNPIKGYAHKHNLWGPVYRMDPSRYMRDGFTYEDVEPYRYVLCATGEHNQCLHEWLINGVLGLVAVSLLLVIPLIVFIRRLVASEGDTYAAAATGIGFVVAFMVFGLTQGAFSYKVIASFYGFVIAGLASYRAPSAEG
ncbi:MAG: O-antigen ligase family protein [Verrucomicrobia bacterium]|nr:O-antigen ligase family protein [Verrucomicrobiota bacterium]